MLQKKANIYSKNMFDLMLTKEYMFAIMQIKNKCL